MSLRKSKASTICTALPPQSYPKKRSPKADATLDTSLFERLEQTKDIRMNKTRRGALDFGLSTWFWDNSLDSGVFSKVLASGHNCKIFPKASGGPPKNESAQLCP